MKKTFVTPLHEEVSDEMGGVVANTQHPLFLQPASSLLRYLIETTSSLSFFQHVRVIAGRRHCR